MKPEYDVIVAGGGTAGVIAAVQAARSGATTLLVERTARLGGTITNANVIYPACFYAWGEQVIAGIGWELVKQTVAESGKELPDFAEAADRPVHPQIPLDPMIYAALCDEYVQKSGCDLLFHTIAADVAYENEQLWRITLATPAGLRYYTAKELIDCTADGHVSAMAGAERRHPETCQPASICCRASGYNVDDLDLDAIEHAFQEAIKRGEVRPEDAGWNVDEPGISLWLKIGGYSKNHVPVNEDITTPEGRTRLEIEGRRSVYRLYRFLKRQPGLENLQINWLAPEIGIRESVTVVGKKTVQGEDYEYGRTFDDALCYAFYPVDIHGLDSNEWEARPLEKGVVPTIPRGALLPEHTGHLCVAGRCISSDRLANSGLRVEANSMAMGQACGAMAALAAQRACDPVDLNLQEVRENLRAHGAIIPA